MAASCSRTRCHQLLRARQAQRVEHQTRKRARFSTGLPSIQAGEKALCRLPRSVPNRKGRAKQRKLGFCSHTLLLLFRALHSDCLESLSVLSQVGDYRTRFVGCYILDHPCNTGPTPLAIELQEGENRMSSPDRIAFQELLLRIVIRDGSVANWHIQYRGEYPRQLST